MKKNIIVPGIFLGVFVLVIVFLYGIALKKKALPVQRVGSPESTKIYSIKSGIITYKVEGSHQGTIVHYFDDWGNQEAKHQDLSYDLISDGSRIVSESFYFKEGDMYYSENHIDKRMSSSAIMSAAFSSDIIDADANLSPKVNLDIDVKDFGKLVGEEKILGKVCKKYKKKESTYWVWDALVLKELHEAEIGDIIHIAIDIKENVSIPSEKLFPPDTELTASELLPPNPQ